VEKQATREAYGQALLEMGARYDNLVVLDADLSKSTKTVDFARQYPERFINVGIAEQNMMGIAAGLSTCGKIVFASSFAIFAAGRAFEIIRNSIAYARCNVKIGASHAGITVGEDGGSHQSVEDISLMRSVPNMTVVVPSDGFSAREAVRALCALDGPAYLRLGRLPTPALYRAGETWTLGRGHVLQDGTDAALIACGMMVAPALEAAGALAREGKSIAVVDMATIKPLDEALILEMAHKTGRLLTVEEHTVLGGLGSAVAEVCGRYHPVPVWRMGLEDVFGQSGKPDELLDRYGLTVPHIADNLRRLLDF
jgi:transketolase